MFGTADTHADAPTYHRQPTAGQVHGEHARNRVRDVVTNVLKRPRSVLQTAQLRQELIAAMIAPPAPTAALDNALVRQTHNRVRTTVSCTWKCEHASLTPSGELRDTEQPARDSNAP